MNPPFCLHATPAELVNQPTEEQVNPLIQMDERVYLPTAQHARQSNVININATHPLISTGQAMANKTYTAEFYSVSEHGKRNGTIFHDLLKAAEHNGYTEALALTVGEDEKHQIRSLTAINKGRAWSGIFGRCRFNETPEQGTEDGQEADVELKPGHGLVEKNHFLFFPANNLLVYQRNRNASSHSRLQQYLNLPKFRSVALEPVLTQDSYERLLAGGEVRMVEFAFQPPKDITLFKNSTMQKAVEIATATGGVNVKVRISAGRGVKNLHDIKDAVVQLARFGFAKTAKVKLEDEPQPIDLIADRVKSQFSVSLQPNGRPTAQAVFAGLESARTSCAPHLKSFFG